jgi:hypothetical protein
MQKCFYIEQILSTSKDHKLIGLFSFNDQGETIGNSTFVFSCVKIDETTIDICKSELKKRNIKCELFSDKIQSIPAVAQKYVPMFISFFQDEVIRNEGMFIPEFVFITPNQIMDRLRSTSPSLPNSLSKNNEPCELQIQIAFSFALLKIAYYFSKNPQYVQEFPLYTAYLKKHNLLQEQMPLETFLEIILTSAGNID